MHSVRVYGLTGGTGSGKTEAARHFAELSFAVIDADRVGHDVIAKGGIAEEAVIEAFGPGILTNGTVDREKLGSRVFEDDAARETLNGIVHPAIFMEIMQRCERYAQEGFREVIVDAALLAEQGRKESFLHGLILVLAPEAVRLERLKEGRGLHEADARARIRAQGDPSRKVPAADWVIHNTGSVRELHAKVERVAEALRSESQVSAAGRQGAQP